MTERKVVALVTLYFPSAENVENVRLISAQVSEVVLSDNTPGADNSALFAGIENARYFANGRNLGLSRAFNARMDLDEVRNSDFLIFFDQDSTVSENQVPDLVRDFEMLEENHRVGSLGPSFFDVNRKELFGLYPSSQEVGGGCFTVPATITSSLVVRYSVIAEIGFWNERIFLDYADLDLGWRLLAAGYENFVTGNVRMTHRMGNPATTVRQPLTRKAVTVALYEPLRLYYQIRDGLKLLSRAYVPAEARKIIKNELYRRSKGRLLYAGNRLKTLKFLLRGVLDALRKIDGEM